MSVVAIGAVGHRQVPLEGKAHEPLIKLSSAVELPRIAAVGTALPRNYAAQETLTAALREFWAAKGLKLDAFDRLHKATKVAGRYLALPMIEYAGLDSFTKSNDAWMRVAPELGAEAAERALSSAGLHAADIDHLFFVSGTGIATPSIDTRIISALGLLPDVKRTPIFGLGCAGGASGVARAADYLRAFPQERALLITVELCSLTLQQGDLSVANMIASGLFGDGAAAVVLSGGGGENQSGPQVIADRPVLYPGTEDAMGWRITEHGFKLVMSSEIPLIVQRHLRGDVDCFLHEQGLDSSHIAHWIAHTGGPRVLRAIEEALELPVEALRHSWRSLEQLGNLSSASVLFVLKDLLEAGAARPGDLGVMLAMGPGFCAELVLLRW
jgi:alkylresorcinol/alkylpyrone synthase